MMTDFNSKQEEQNELYEHHRFNVDRGQSPIRIDKYLTDKIENATRNKIQQAASAESILVNGKAVKSNYKVKPLDVISIVLTYPPREIDLIPEDIPVDIIYEDDDLLVVEKPAGMVVHPAYGNYSGTLVNALIYLLNKANPTDIKHHPLLVHRIDKDTSGLLLVAKTETAQTLLAREFFNHTIHRKYLALVWGDFEKDEGRIEGNIGRNLKDRKVMSVYPDGDHGKHAVTQYRVIERFGYVTLLECQLETGRTHQIRAHMQYIGHPLFSDATYGGDQILKGTTFTKYKQFVKNCFSIINRQALHAFHLGFNHPILKNPLSFHSELPDDFAELLEKWRTYVKHKAV